jgi:hypothetical protein
MHFTKDIACNIYIQGKTVHAATGYLIGNVETERE